MCLEDEVYVQKVIKYQQVVFLTTEIAYGITGGWEVQKVNQNQENQKAFKNQMPNIYIYICIYICNIYIQDIC